MTTKAQQDDIFNASQLAIFYSIISPVKRDEALKAVQLVLEYELAQTHQAGDFLANLYLYNYRERGCDFLCDDVCGMVLDEVHNKFNAELKEYFEDDEVSKEQIDHLINEELGVMLSGVESDFLIKNDFILYNDSTKGEIEDKIIDIIQKDGDIALSNSSKKLLQKIGIDLDECRQKAKEDEKKEQEEEQEVEQMAAYRKHRQRLYMI